MDSIKTLYQTPQLVVATTQRGEEAAGSDNYSGFSVCHYTGDAPEHYMRCREQLAARFGTTVERLIIPRQTHSANVAVVDALPVSAESLESIDSVIITGKEMIAGVSTADCLPVVLVANDGSMAAAVHAGWRGAVGGVVENTVAEMRRLGAGALEAVLAPAICGECFEVGEEVAGQFPEGCVIRREGKKPHVDLRKYVRSVLEGLGVTVAADCDDCTRCHPERYFSARAMGINSGRNFTFVVKR